MKTIIFILFIISIISITYGYTLYINKCPPKKIEIRYIKHNQINEQFNNNLTNQINEQFNNQLNEPIKSQ